MKTTRHGLLWVIAGAAMVIASSTTGCGSDDEGDNVNVGGAAGQAGLGGGGSGGKAGAGGTAGQAGSAGMGGTAGKGGAAGAAGQATGGAAGTGGAATGGAAGEGGAATGGAAGEGGAATGGAAGEGGAATGGAAGECGAATGGAAGEGGAATGGAAGEGGAATGGAAGEGGAATGGAAGEGGAATGGAAGTGGSSTGGAAGEGGAATGGAAGTGGSSTGGAAGEGGAAGSGGTPGALFFSEYVEGSGTNKAVGIYNAGTSAYDLTQCVVNRYTGATQLQTPASVFPAGATLQPGDEYVLCDDGPGATLSPLCDYIDANLNYNGDDALALDCGGSRLDIIGQIGTDPGTAWGTGELTTLNHTLRRKCHITQGDMIPGDAFDPAVEWTSFPQDTFDGLGTRGCVMQTIQIDGTNDFPTAATFTTSSASYAGFITWDTSSIYLGMSGADVGSNSAQRWWHIYIGTGATPSTTTGQQYTGQQATLPFSARYHVRWKADNSYTNAQVWDGTQWAEASWDFTGKIYQTGSFVELQIPKSFIGSPTDHIQIVMAMVEEATPGWTYAGVPSSTFTDGADPNYASYYDFDLNSGVLPSSYTPKP